MKWERSQLGGKITKRVINDLFILMVLKLRLAIPPGHQASLLGMMI